MSRAAHRFAWLARPALLAFALIAGANLLGACWEDELARLRDPDRFVWRSKIQALRNGELADRRVWILGDSQTMSGILPAELGAPPDAVYNLGLPAMQPEGLQSLLQWLPEQSEAPEPPRSPGEPPAPGELVAIVNIDPYSLFRSHVTRAFQNYYRLELLRYDLAGALARDPDVAGSSVGDLAHQALLFAPLYELHFALHPLIAFGEQGLSDLPFADARANPALLPAAQYSAYLKDAPSPQTLIAERRGKSTRIAAALAADAGFWIWRNYDPIPNRAAENACDRSAKENRAKDEAAGGTRENDSHPAYDGAAMGALQFRPRPQAERMWRNLFQALLDRGYRIAVVQLPFSPEWDRLSDAEVVYGGLDLKLDAILADLPGERIQRVPRPPRELFSGPKDFHDATHLSRCGALRYTRWLRSRLGEAR